MTDVLDIGNLEQYNSDTLMKEILERWPFVLFTITLQPDSSLVVRAEGLPLCGDEFISIGRDLLKDALAGLYVQLDAAEKQ